MPRVEITAKLVREAEWLALFGIRSDEIAARLGITPYLANLLVRNASLPSRVGRNRESSRRVLNAQPRVDVMTVHCILRMLEVGWLSQRQIAREAGVSAALVNDIAAGRRPAISMAPIEVGEGEELLMEPARCGGCGALILVVPCRACMLRLDQGEP